MRARGSQMERLIEAAGGAKAENQRPSIHPTSGQMERLIAAMGGAPAENQRPGKYPTTGQMERLIQAAGGAPAEDQLPGRYATSGQMERLIAAVGGEPAEDQVPGKYVTAGQMERLIQAIGSGGGEIVTVAGITPLILTNALARDIRSLVQQGKLVLNGDNIVCNNGVLRLVHRSGLPSGYKLLEYVGSSGAAYVVTDVFLASTDVVEAEFRNNSTTGYGSLYGVFRLGDSSALYANQTYYGYNESNDKVDTGLRVNTDWHSSRHDFVNGTLTIDDTTVTFTPWEFANTTKNAVLARYYNNSYGYIWKGFIRKFKVTRGGEVICDLLPAKNEQDEAGLYDLISGNFYRATSGTLVAGDEVNDYEPAVVGTPEVLTLGGANIWDEEWEYGRYNTSTGEPNNDYGVRSKNYIPVKSGETYRIVCGSITANDLRVLFYREDHSYIQATAWIHPGATFTLTGGTESAAYIKFFVTGGNYGTSYKNDIAINYPATATEYAPYTTQTASVEDLLAVGSFRDEQDIIAGKVTRRTVAIVYDGTQDVGEDYVGDLTEGSIVVYAPSETYSGAVAEFETAAATQMHSLTITLTLTQDLHGYDKPWPGGGGKNLFDAYATGSENGYIDNSGAVIYVAYQRASDYIKVEAGYAYTVSLNRQASNIGFAFFDENKQIVLPRIDKPRTSSTTITAPSGVAYLRFWIYINASENLTADKMDKTFHVMMNEGTTAAAYEPYSNICPITGHDSVRVWVQPTHDTTADPAATVQLGQTVYGGTLDVVSGELVVTMAMVNLGALTWARQADSAQVNPNGTFYTSTSPCPFKGWNNAYSNAASNVLAPATSSGTSAREANSTFWWNNAATGWRIIWGKPNGGSTIDELRALLADLNVTVVAELATPITTQLTPTQVSTILGQNRVWSDGGETKVVLPVERIEYVDPQPLRTSAGSNTIRVTSEVGEVELEVTYRRKSS